MSTLTPLEVTYNWLAEIFDGDDYIPLDVSNVIPSMDMDRSPFCQATLTLEGVTDELFAKLDPRNPPSTSTGPLRFQMWCEDAAGNDLSWLGRRFETTRGTWLNMWIQTARRDYVTGQATVTVADGESRLIDKRRISGAAVDTGAAFVISLVEWALYDVFGSATTTGDPLALSTAIPAGDRRAMQPGETFLELITPELQAIDYRLYSYWDRVWAVYAREHTPLPFGSPLTVELSTYTHSEGAPAFADPIVWEMSETLDRTGDYADGVLVRYDMTPYGGTVTTQRSGSGANTKGRVITYERPAPTGNAADSIVQRTRIRGRDLQLTARARFDVLPGMTASIYTRHGIPAGSIRSVEWNGADGTMTLSIQTGLPVE